VPVSVPVVQATAAGTVGLVGSKLPRERKQGSVEYDRNPIEYSEGTARSHWSQEPTPGEWLHDAGREQA
jgi:hypothetical protein